MQVTLMMVLMSLYGTDARQSSADAFVRVHDWNSTETLKFFEFYASTELWCLNDEAFFRWSLQYLSTIIESSLSNSDKSITRLHIW